MSTYISTDTRLLFPEFRTRVDLSLVKHPDIQSVPNLEIWGILSNEIFVCLILISVGQYN